MKIAVASQNKQKVTGHLGHCQRFWLYETKEGEIHQKYLLELDKEQSFHHSSRHQPHPLDEVQVVIAGGMGKGLGSRLKEKGIEGIVTPETEPDQAVKAYLNGSLVQGESGEGHDHHHHHHHHHHEQNHQCQCSN